MQMARQEAELCIFGMGTGSVTMFSLLMYTIIIQMVIPPMYQELRGRTPEIFRSCLIKALICLFFIFAAVMISGYAVFGPSVASNVMDNMPNDTWGWLARVSMSLCVLGCYPLNLKPMAAPFARTSSPSTVTDPLLDSDGVRGAAPEQRQSGCSGGVVVATVVIVAAVSTATLWLYSYLYIRISTQFHTFFRYYIF